MVMPVATPPLDQIVDADFRVQYGDEIANQSRTIGPKPPPWYAPRARPNLKHLREQAHEQRTRHQLRLIQGIMMELRAGLEVSSIFERDMSWVAAGEIERFRFPLIARATTELASFMEATTIQLTSPALGIPNQNEASTKDDALFAFIDHASKAHFRAGYGNLRKTVAYDYLNHGMNAFFIRPNPANEITGVDFRAVDPKVVYPMFSPRGVERVYSIYHAGPDEMEANFGDGPGGSATRRIRDIARDKGDTEDYDACHEVIEYWDREWGFVWWRDELIRKWRHKYWLCPWIIGRPAWRTSRQTSLGMNSDNGLPGGMLNQQGREAGGTSEQRDLARVYEPFFTSALPLNEILEMIGSHLLTGVRDARDPALYWRKSQMSAADGPPEINAYGHGVTEDEEGSALDLLPTAPIADHLDPLLTLLTQQMQMIFPPSFIQGQQIGSGASGQAINVLNDSGYAKWTSAPSYEERLWGEVGERFLTIHHEWGDMLGKEGNRGFTPVPSRTPNAYGELPSHDLTRELLDRSGCQTRCRINRFSLKGMTDAAATAQILHTTMGLMDDVSAIELLGFSENPQRTVEMRRFQDLMKSPDYIKTAMLPWMVEQVRRAWDNNDIEDAWKLMTMARRLSWMQQTQDMQMAMMSGMGQDPMSQLQQMDPAIVQQFLAEQGPVGGSPAGPGAPGTTATGLISPRDINNGVGLEGGRHPLASLPDGGIG